MRRPNSTPRGGRLLCRLWTMAVLAAVTGGCGRGASDVPRIALGKDVCAECGMTIADPRFAAAIRDDHAVRVYDSVECVLRTLRRSGESMIGGVWLADFPSGELKPAGGMRLVLAGYPSPMGGGWAAFADSARARTESAERQGVAGTLADAVRGMTAKKESP